MIGAMNENLLVVGVQSYLKKLIHMVVLRQELFKNFQILLNSIAYAA